MPTKPQPHDLIIKYVCNHGFVLLRVGQGKEEVNCGVYPLDEYIPLGGIPIDNPIYHVRQLLQEHGISYWEDPTRGARGVPQPLVYVDNSDKDRRPIEIATLTTDKGKVYGVQLQVNGKPEDFYIVPPVLPQVLKQASIEFAEVGFIQVAV
jgi:hypothetical protein